MKDRAATARVVDREDYVRQGYVAGLPVYAPEDVRRLQDMYWRLRGLLPAGASTQQMDWWHAVDRELYEVCTDPTILDYVEQLLGPDFYLWGSQFFSKDPGDGRTVPWHQDAFYWPLSPHKTVTVWLALADSDRDNGGMMVVPGSHRAGRLQHRHSACDSDVLEMTLEEGSFSSADAVCLTLQAGEISMHDDNIVHGSGPNRSARLRCGLTMRYSAGEVKCNTTVWPFFKAFWARGTDRWRHNPRAAPPDRLMTEYIAITPIIGQRL